MPIEAAARMRLVTKDFRYKDDTRTQDIILTMVTVSNVASCETYYTIRLYCIGQEEIITESLKCHLWCRGSWELHVQCNRQHALP